MKKGMCFVIMIGWVMCVLLGCTGENENSQNTEVNTDTNNIMNQDADEVVTTQEIITTEKPVTTEDPITTRINQMTLEEKVAQMFWVRCPDGDATDIQSRYQFGGYILFDKDFKNQTVDSVTSNISSYQGVSKIPMVIGADEEGGTVCRVSYYSTFRASKFSSPRTLYQQGGMDAITTDAVEKAGLLSSLGINVNLAPVCDIAVDPNDYMYSRSIGLEPEQTGEVVANIVSTSQSNGVGAVLKHFPGYGNNVNTHTGIAIDKRPYEQFQSTDFVPFEKGIEAGAGCVLVSHNIVECMDSENPASLSPKVHEILRDELGFDGVIMTDDLSMEAITDYTDGAAAAVDAVNAGNDLLCVDDYEVQHQAVMDAVINGSITLEQIDVSVTRILYWKQQLGIME